MNERIRELAEQVGEYAKSVYTPPVRSKTPGKIWEDGHIDWYEIFNQKFAELIVRECALVANLHNEEAEGVNLGVGKVIKEHFGVEE